MSTADVLRHESRLFLVAVQFLTRIPVPSWVGYRPEWLEASVRHYPGVGALVGFAAALVALSSAAFWPAPVAATLAVCTATWLTAAFHEDGLADTFDALLGSAPRERALVIMRDSRIGSYGAVALIGTFVLRFTLVAQLLSAGVMIAGAALIASHAAGRAASVALMSVLPYARELPEAVVKPLARRVRMRDGVLAGVTGAAVVGAGLWGAGVTEAATRFAAVLLGLACLVVVMRGWLRRRLGGYTGDTLGATEQLGEIIVLLAWTAS